jgi:hypothetical protein
VDQWTMVLEAVPGSVAAVRVDEDEYRPVEAELVDADAATLGNALAAVVEAEGSHPEHLVLVVPGDLEPERFAGLTEAVELAGLPEPSWLPDAVAWAGEQLARWEAGRAVLVMDARGDEIGVWSVRTADDGVEIARGGALDLTGRLDALLAGVVHAKLAVVEPEFAESLRRRADAAGRRDAAHLSRELREARRLMCTTDGEELVVSAGEAEVYLTRPEFTHLVEHALRDTVTDAVGPDHPDVPTILVADRTTPVIEHLAEVSGATLLSAPAGATSLDGAVALVLPRPLTDEDADGCFEDPDPTDAIPALPGALPAKQPGSALVRPPRPLVSPGSPPRWAVPALSTLLVLTLAGAGAVLVTAPSPAASAADAVSPIVPVGLDRFIPGR